MKNYLNKIKLYIVAHKKISIIVLIIILLLGFWIYKKVSNNSGEIRYVTSVVEKGTIISSVSGTGQVSASNQVDLKAKVSGDIVSINVKSGKKVLKGTLIAQIDAEEMQKSLRDAELSLQSAKISLEKLKIQNSKENISADLQKAYDDGFTDVSDAFLDLPSVLTGLEDVLAETNLSSSAARSAGKTAINYRDQAEKLYYTADDSYKNANGAFRDINRESSVEEIEKVIGSTYDVVKTLSDALKTAKNFVDYMADDAENNSNFTSAQDSLSEYINTISGHLSVLYSAKQEIETNKDGFLTSDLDLQSSEISVQQKENSLKDLKDELADYYVRAPFSGTVADIAVEKSDSISSGTTVATFITESKIAEIPFNEVDIAQIESGQKATLIFDAISDLTISGEVVEVDSVGTVSSGVVNYNVKISFDTQDERIKPGMSVTASVITDMAQDVLVVSSSAVKTKNGTSYVEVFSNALAEVKNGELGSISSILPEKKVVKVGLSDDTTTEIISGIKEGEIVVVKTVSGSSSSSTTSSTKSILSSMSGKNNKSSSNSAGGPPPGM